MPKAKPEDAVEDNGETIASIMPSRTNEEAEPDEVRATESEEAAPEKEQEAEDAPGDGPAPDAPGDEGEKPEGKEKPALDWRERRRIEETNKRREAEAKLAAAMAELDVLKKGSSPNPDSPAESDRSISMEEARRLAKAELEAEQSAARFREATGRVLQNGIQSIPDFEEARQEMVRNFGEQLNARPDFFEAITDPDIPNGHEIFYALARDPEQTERLLRMPPVKMAIEIAKLSEKVAKPAVKAISRAPAPVRPVAGSTQASTRLDDPNTPQDAWAKEFWKTMRAKGL